MGGMNVINAGLPVIIINISRVHTWLEILVIIPKHDMYDNLERTCVTPDLSILNLLIDQFPLKLKFDILEQLIRIYFKSNLNLFI